MVALDSDRTKLFKLPKKDVTKPESDEHNVIDKVYKIVRALFIVAGIYICYLTSSYYQEKLNLSFTRVKNKDSISIFLILLLYLTNSICGLIYVLIRLLYNKINNNTNTTNVFNPFISLNKRSMQKLSLISLSLTGSALSSTLALKHITFPTQVLVKSGKMIPIVLGSYIIFGKRYDSFEYIMVIIITISLVFFNIFKTFTDSNDKKTILGVGLCFLSLLFDSYTGPSQEQLLNWCKLDPITMMFIVNSYSFIFMLIISIFNGMEPYNFVMYNPILRKNVFFHTISAAIGQFFMYFSIDEFGSLYTCIITTTRKAVTTIISIYFFGHKISIVQWVCILAIFSTLLAHQYYKAHIKQAAQTAQKVK